MLRLQSLGQGLAAGSKLEVGTWDGSLATLQPHSCLSAIRACYLRTQSALRMLVSCCRTVDLHGQPAGSLGRAHSYPQPSMPRLLGLVRQAYHRSNDHDQRQAAAVAPPLASHLATTPAAQC